MLCREDRKELIMASLAPLAHSPRSNAVSNVVQLDPDSAWAAFERRDRSWDGRVIGAVKTTGIYCKPSCPARRPKREHVEFFASAEEARVAGYRSCLRCKPDEVGRDREAVAKAVKLIERTEDPLTLDELAGAVGYAPHHFQRIFKRDLGVSPAEYARALRNRRTEAALKANGRVTDAVYDAGYSGPSTVYSVAKARLGMTPSAWREGGRGESMRSAHCDSPVGETRSYAQIAAAIGQPSAVRAVGTANGDNHVAVLIPCHRVIRSDGSLGGYAGGLDRKRKLLSNEQARGSLL